MTIEKRHFIISDWSDKTASQILSRAKKSNTIKTDNSTKRRKKWVLD